MSRKPKTPTTKEKREPQTVRSVFNDLVAKGVCPNTEECYQVLVEKFARAYLDSRADPNHKPGGVFVVRVANAS
jgi:hypothetical protein